MYTSIRSHRTAKSVMFRYPDDLRMERRRISNILSIL